MGKITPDHLRKRPLREGEGRPTKYRPEFCEMLIDHMSKGLSFESFGAIVDTHKEALYNWAKKHPEFSNAKRKGTAKCKLFYEKVGLAGMMGKIQGFNGNTWRLQMQNRFGWGEKTKVEIENLKPTIINKIDGTKEILGYKDPNIIEGELVEKD